MKVYIQELQNADSTREGYYKDVANLASAKRLATRNQFFQGTTLTISLDDKVLAIKQKGVWRDL